MAAKEDMGAKLKTGLRNWIARMTTMLETTPEKCTKIIAQIDATMGKTLVSLTRSPFEVRF